MDKQSSVQPRSSRHIYDNKRNWVLNTEVFFAIVLSTEPRIRIMPLVDMEASHEVKVWRWVCE